MCGWTCSSRATSARRAPYKGHASYFSAAGAPNIAWTYLDPLLDAEQIRGLVAFFDERADVTVDGEQQERPRTQWS